MLADHTQSGCSIEEVLHYIDNSIQYGEDADVKIRDFENEDADEPDEWCLFDQGESESLTDIKSVCYQSTYASAAFLLATQLTAWNYHR